MSAARSISCPTSRRTTASICGAWRDHSERIAASSPSMARWIVSFSLSIDVTSLVTAKPFTVYDCASVRPTVRGKGTPADANRIGRREPRLGLPSADTVGWACSEQRRPVTPGEPYYGVIRLTVARFLLARFDSARL